MKADVVYVVSFEETGPKGCIQWFSICGVFDTHALAANYVSMADAHESDRRYRIEEHIVRDAVDTDADLHAIVESTLAEAPDPLEALKRAKWSPANAANAHKRKSSLT